MLTVLTFGAYLLVCLVVPGTLLWRAARGRAASLAEDLAPGLAVGYAVEVLGYLAGRTVLVAPVAVLLAFVAVPRLRRFWRTGPDADRPPPGWLVATVAIVAVLMVLTWAGYLRSHPMPYHFNDGDLPFHLALIGEARHHLPMQVPWVAGEPLRYHWFAYLHLASASRITGIEPETLLLRLYHLPLIAALPAALGVAARRLTGRWWPGPVAAVITFFVLAPDLYARDAYLPSGFGPVDDASMLRPGLWVSVTQTFAALVCVPVVILLIGAVRGSLRRTEWVLLTGLVVVLAGAKATYLPIILCGLIFAAVRTRTALGCAALVGGGFLAAQVVLLGRASQGMVLDPLGSLAMSGLAVRGGVTPVPVLAAATVLSWVVIWCGVLVPRIWRDPAHRLLIGMGAAGMGGVLAFRHYGQGETWFLVAARPYLSLAAAGGIAVLVSSRHVARAVAAGLVTCLGLAAGAGVVARSVTTPVPAKRSAMPDGTREAARWLRANSSPDDLVATNAHCRMKRCDNLHFWFAAFSERRFLVEGWGFTAKANAARGTPPVLAPFWDPVRLAANDAVFTDPSPATVDRLRSSYGVRWLFVQSPGPGLDEVAHFRFRSGDCAIYELAGARPGRSR